MDFDLFGDPVIEDVLLRDKFLEPPFSVLDTKSGSWQARKNAWKALGIRSEVGRNSVVIHMDSKAKEANSSDFVSIFDPALCELMYSWFSEDGGIILDPFAGGSVRGIVASRMNRNYIGIDIRPEQVKANKEQGEEICPQNPPLWICGDSAKTLGGISENADLIFSCPPYADLEVYSDIPGDISNMPYHDFLAAYREIINLSVERLKPNGYAVFVVGEVRGKGGGYLGFVPDTIRAFMDCGMLFYNEAILLNAIASASMRAANNMKSGKLCKVHQNVLVFKKPMKSIENGLA